MAKRRTSWRSIRAPPGVQAAKIGLIGFHVLGRDRFQRRFFAGQQCHIQLPNDLPRDVRLSLEDIVEILVVALRPDVGIVGDTDEPRGHAHAARTVGRLLPADRSAKNVVDSKLLSDLLRALVRVRELAGAVLGYHA